MKRANVVKVLDQLEADLARSFGQDELRQLVELLKRFRHVDTEPHMKSVAAGSSSR
jgi:hypothetical protein